MQYSAQKGRADALRSNSLKAEGLVMKIGIMGGTFDPVHNGHLTLAQAALDQFDLDEIWFLPNGNPPHKQEVTDEVHLGHRVRMVEAAIRPYSAFRLCMYEAERKAVSYSYATMEHFRMVYPEHRFYFIVGADSLLALHTWKHPERLVKTCVLLASCRDDVDNSRLESAIRQMNRDYHSDIRLLKAPKVPVSSREIRKLIASGSCKQADIYLPGQVAAYIKEHCLYKNTAALYQIEK